MTTLPAELEALMPEPTYIYHAAADGEDDLFEVAVSGRVECESCTLLYTADQMREAILAATERAAKLAEAARDAAPVYRDEYDICNELAAAIRARTGGEQT